MRRRFACILVAMAATTSGCYSGATSPGVGSPAGLGTARPAPPSEISAPSPTIGYCGMDPEPVPCGTEEVEATLAFDVVWFKPGATFTILDVVVR